MCHRRIGDWRFPIADWRRHAECQGFAKSDQGLCSADMKVFRALPESREGRVLGQQLLRSASSVAANYRAACRARSHRDFIFKLGIVEEEADETLFWLEFIAEAGLIPRSKLKDLISEAGQITAIIVASRKTAKSKNRQSEIANRKSS